MSITKLLLNKPPNWSLWLSLAVLLFLVWLVGGKASAPDVESAPNSFTNRPMLAFEMAADKAPILIKNWNGEVKGKLREALLWDYLFILIYPLSISVACLIAGRFLEAINWISFKYCLIVIVLQWVAALFDSLENYALLNVLQGGLDGSWPQVSKWCAIIKFGLIILGLIYSVGIGGIGWGIKLIANWAR
jgi:hypothetical protein